MRGMAKSCTSTLWRKNVKGWRQFCRTLADIWWYVGMVVIKRKEKNKRYILLLVSSVPGLGHLILGQLKSGFHLLVFTIGMTAVVICRWEIFINSLLSPNIGNLTASVFIVVSIISCIIFSILNVHFILKKSNTKKTGISPMKLAFRRFKVNQLAMIATYVIIIFYMMVYTIFCWHPSCNIFLKRIKH